MATQGILCIQFSGNIQCYMRVEKYTLSIPQYCYKPKKNEAVFDIVLWNSFKWTKITISDCTITLLWLHKMYCMPIVCYSSHSQCFPLGTNCLHSRPQTNSYSIKKFVWNLLITLVFPHSLTMLKCLKKPNTTQDMEKGRSQRRKTN